MEIVIANNALTKKQVFKLTLFTSYVAYVIFGCFLVLLMYFLTPSMFATDEVKDLLTIPLAKLVGPMFNAITIAISCTLLSFFVNQFSITPLSPIQSNTYSSKNYFFFTSVGVFILCTIMFWPMALIGQASMQSTWFLAAMILLPFINGILNGAVLCGAVSLLQKFNFLTFSHAQTAP